MDNALCYSCVYVNVEVKAHEKLCIRTGNDGLIDWRLPACRRLPSMACTQSSGGNTGTSQVTSHLCLSTAKIAVAVSRCCLSQLVQVVSCDAAVLEP